MADDFEKDLSIEEFKSCRALIKKNIDIMEKNEVYALGAAGALFVFSISATSRDVALSAAWTPLAISIIGFLRFCGLDKTIDLTNEYLIELENLHSGLGWVKFYKDRNAETGKILKKSRLALGSCLKSLALPSESTCSCMRP